MPKTTILEGLTEAQKKRAESIQTKDDLLAFIQDEDIDLTDEQLETVSGGDDYSDAVNDIGVG